MCMCIVHSVSDKCVLFPEFERESTPVYKIIIMEGLFITMLLLMTTDFYQRTQYCFFKCRSNALVQFRIAGYFAR